MPDEARLADLRAGLYQLHAAAFQRPDPERMERLLAAGRRLLRAGATRYPFHSALRAYLDVAEKEAHSARLTETFAELFEAAWETSPGPPLASAYWRGPSDAGRLLGFLDDAYRRAGLAVRPEAGGHPDHVSSELELLAAQCLREAEAWRAGDSEEALRWRREALSILRPHFLRWFPLFRTRVHVHDCSGLWAALVESTYAFATHDAALLNLWTRPVVVAESRP